MNNKLSESKVTLLFSLFLTIFYNYSFFSKVLVVYPANIKNIFFLIINTNFFILRIVTVLIIYTGVYFWNFIEYNLTKNQNM